MNKTRYAEKQRKHELNPQPETVSKTQSLFEETKTIQNEPETASIHDFQAINVFPAQAQTSNKPATIQADFGNSNQGNQSFGFDFQPVGGGEHLQPTALAKMQNAFGQDFSSVKIHQDGQAEKLGAHAFTVGEDIYFSGSTYKPQDPSGQQLLGHELTHVVQQRENRVHAPETGGAATVYQDPALEQEADQFGHDAAAGIKVPTASTTPANATPSAIQQKPVLQPVIPAVLAAISSSGIMTWAAAASTETAISTLATIGGAAASAGSAIGSAIAPGQSGVQEVQIQPWMCDADKHKLEFILQCKLVNAYVEAWARAHPGVDLANPNAPETTSTTTTTTTGSTTPTPSPTPVTPGTPTPTPGSSSTSTTTATTTRDGSATASGGGVDTAIANAVKAQVQMEIEMAINANQRTATDQEFIWSDSGDSTADWIGTVGAIKFSQVMSSYLTENILLSPNALKIPGLALPMQGSSLTVKLFRGGRMHRGPSMSIGWGDNLSINLIGGGPTLDQAEPSMTYATSWNWDGNTTSLNVKISMNETGVVSIVETRRDGGNPDDNSWY